MSTLDVVVTDPVSGRDTGLAKTVRRAIKALKTARIPFCVVGPIAQAAGDLPRMTCVVELVVLSDDGCSAIEALRKTGFKSVAPAAYQDLIDPMVVFEDPLNHMEVDLLIAAGNPEALIISAAPRTRIFGAMAPVATLEQLLLMYLYSNQPKHLGDFAAIVNSGKANLSKTTKMLSETHPDMLRGFRKRVKASQSPPPAPQKPRGKR